MGSVLKRHYLLIGSLMLLALSTRAQGQSADIDQLSAERHQIIQMIDSLNHRIGEIDDLLSQVDPGKRLEAMISKYGKNKGRMIAEGKVWPSISYQMAKDSWGAPSSVQKTAITTGETQKWSYGDNKYLYFKNGRLESWRE